MSKSTENVITSTYSGKLGNQVVLRNRNGKSVIAKRPKQPKKEPSEAQLSVRKNFKKASDWAKSILTDPQMKEAYEARAGEGKTAYLVALNDFLHHPTVDSIEAEEYQGNPGDVIRIDASDDFRVTAVHVKIIAANGTLIEQGACIADTHQLYWIYTATETVASLTGVTIRARATDIPGHKGEAMLTLE